MTEDQCPLELDEEGRCSDHYCCPRPGCDCEDCKQAVADGYKFP